MELMRQLHVLMHVKGGLPSNCFPLLPPTPFPLTTNHISQTNLIYNMPFVNLAPSLVGYSTCLGLSLKLCEYDAGGRNRKREKDEIVTEKERKIEAAEYQDHGQHTETAGVHHCTSIVINPSTT